MIDMKIEKIKKKLRKLDYWQRMELMDWLNAWYQAEKEEYHHCQCLSCIEGDYCIHQEDQ